MSDRLPRVTAKEIMRVLGQKGFLLSRSSGSHHIFKNPAGKRVTVSVHSGKIISPKVLKSILYDMDISVAELKAALKK